MLKRGVHSGEAGHRHLRNLAPVNRIILLPVLAQIAKERRTGWPKALGVEALATVVA